MALFQVRELSCKPLCLTYFQKVSGLSTYYFLTVRYHIGSLAFGAFIIAVVQLIRIIIEFLEKQLRGQYHIICLNYYFYIIFEGINYARNIFTLELAGPHAKPNPIRDFFFK